MNAHYEVVVSCFLAADTPGEVLDELRWHLGLLDDRPPHLDAETAPYPALEPDPDQDDRLPGGEFGSLQRQPRGEDGLEWGLYVRLRVAEDDLGDVLDVVSVLAPHVAQEGYGGHVRDEEDEEDLTLISFGGGDEFELVRR